MIEVLVKYNAYIPKMEIRIGDSPLSSFSPIRGYLEQPFSVWCSVLFPLIAREVNEQYRIIYSGQKAEFELLKSFRTNADLCCEMKFVPPYNDMPSLARIRMLNRLRGLNMVPLIKKSKVRIGLCGSLRNNITLNFPNTFFASPDISDFPDKDNDMAKYDYVLCVTDDWYEAEETARRLTDEGQFCCIVVGKDGSGSTAEGWPVFACLEEQLQEAVDKVSSVILYPDLLHAAVDKCRQEMDGEPCEEFRQLLCIDQEITLVFPSTLDVGKEYRIEINGDISPDDLMIAQDGDPIVFYRNGCLFAEKTGERKLEFYLKANHECVAVRKVSCSQRIYVSSLRFLEEEIEMEEHEKRPYHLEIKPGNADSQNVIALDSNQPLVAYAEKGVIVAREPGECLIRASCNGKESICRVIVRPVMKDFEVSPSELNLNLHDVARFEIRQIPPDSFPRQFKIVTEPDHIVSVFWGTKRIEADASGDATVTLSAEGIRKEIRIHVSAPQDSMAIVYVEAENKQKPKSFFTRLKEFLLSILTGGLS